MNLYHAIGLKNVDSLKSRHLVYKGHCVLPLFIGNYNKFFLLLLSVFLDPSIRRVCQSSKVQFKLRPSSMVAASLKGVIFFGPKALCPKGGFCTWVMLDPLNCQCIWGCGRLATVNCFLTAQVSCTLHPSHVTKLSGDSSNITTSGCW